MSTRRLLEIANVSVQRGGREVIHDVSLMVEHGERIALVGPNAAGKSTLLASAAGLLFVASGQIHAGGRALRSLSGREIAREIALVVALHEGAPKLTVRESTELGRYPHTGPMRGLSSADQDAIARALTETGVDPLGHRSLGSLSAGERQRALIARALAQEPKILLLDEPSAHLDVGHVLDLFALLTTIAARGVAIVAVVHDLVSAAHWASRMVVMHEGRIIDDGPPAAIMGGAALARAFGVTITEAKPSDSSRPSTWQFNRGSQG